MYSSVISRLFTKLYNHYHNLFLEHFHYPKNKSLTFFCSHFPSTPRLPPQPQATTNLPFISLDLFIVGISYKQHHAICDLLFTYFVKVLHCFSFCMSLLSFPTRLFPPPLHASPNFNWNADFSKGPNPDQILGPSLWTPL